MSQPQALTTQQIQNYQDRIANAGTLAQQKAAAIAVYQELYDKGYNYAGWALGVAKGNTITGTAALDYLSGKNWGQIPIDLIVHADSTCERTRYSLFSLSIDQRLVSVSPKPMLVF